MEKNSLIYITGTPGAGKSTVCADLKERGYTAFDTDNDSIARFYDNDSGEPVTTNVPSEERTPEWRLRHTWKAKRETIEALRREAEENGPVFLCGVTANDADELWDLFSMVFALVVDDESILRTRVSQRSEDGYGKNPHELAALIKWQRTAEADYRKLGAVIIDASRPVGQVVDSILEQAVRTKDS